jgi:hypothetical protein
MELLVVDRRNLATARLQCRDARNICCPWFRISKSYSWTVMGRCQASER